MPLVLGIRLWLALSAGARRRNHFQVALARLDHYLPSFPSISYSRKIVLKYMTLAHLPLFQALFSLTGWGSLSDLVPHGRPMVIFSHS